MNKDFLQLRSNRILLSIVALFLFVGMANDAWSQNFTYPQIPELSLTGADESYNTDWYPDGRIWLPVTQRDGAPREFLMPVFIDNKWWHYKSTDLARFLVPEPIYSFRFKLLYDGVAVTPVDIVTTHPFPEDDSRAQNVRGDNTPPLAKDFNITWSVHNDLSYQEYYLEAGDPPIPLSTREKGRALVISAAGTQPLPVTDTNTIDFNVLLYVKFRINLERGSITPDQVSSQYTPMYISPDTVMYNDWNVRKEIAFKHLLYSDSVNIRDRYPDPNAPGTYVGLNGMNNRQITSLWNTEPILPGTIYLKLTDKLPRIWYELSRSGSQPPMWDNINNPDEAPLGSWKLRDPLTVDSSQMYVPDVYGSVKMTLLNSTSETRLLDLWVESDAPWLKFDIYSPNRSKYTQIDPTLAYIYYIDNAILGEGADKPDPMGNLTAADEVVELTVKCDPAAISSNGGELAGVYTGYITFRSHTAEVSPVRMQVTFINFRNPFEPDDGSFMNDHNGVTVMLQNTKAGGGDETRIVFGLGHRATEGVDELFGEFAYTGAQNDFGARFYHPDEDFRNDQGMPFGFGDMVPNVDNPYAESRDIRNINDTAFSHVFLCRFDDGDNGNNYPIKIMWDTSNFPVGAQLFLSDTANGALFPSVNMREATHVYGNVLGYTITDANIVSFKIEYTQPRIIDYVDADGNPKIKKGWNFLSMPVRPKNSTWNVYFANALNKPYNFFGNGFQEQEILKVGVGYFVKYSDRIDSKFKGTPMMRVTMDGTDDGFPDKVLCNEGWNTIGALSYPMNVSYVDFDEVDVNTSKPSKGYVRNHGFWGYKTNVGYYEASVMEPGLGYWVKVDPDAAGYLRLIHPEITRLDVNENWAKQNALSASTQLNIRDNGQHETNLYMTADNKVDASIYELPPLPPAGLFDVRFYTNRILATDEESVINMQGVDYPVSITIDNADANYVFTDAVTGEVLGQITKGNSSNVEIKSTANDAIKVLKSEVTDGLTVSNQPNPVNNTSTIKFNVPVDGNVLVTLFDAIGNAVVLSDEFRTAGEHTVTLDASSMASGSYMCKVVSGTNSSVVMINVVK